jgi:leucyl/phenylalanyl-tRNA--protein transferase
VPIFELPEDEIVFPKPELAEADGLLAVGGDLSPLRLLTAYSLGIFPWFNEDNPILWWSLDPRLLCFPREITFSKSLLKRIKRNEFDVKIDTDFRKVMEVCASIPRNGQKGTWITPQIIDSYTQLHQMGYAHSFETYKENRLVGGLYGVSLGAMFSGESMFHLETDASKVAFYYLIQFAIKHHFHFIDCQQVTSHMLSMGGRAVARKEFLVLLDKSLQKQYLKDWEKE